VQERRLAGGLARFNGSVEARGRGGNANEAKGERREMRMLKRSSLWVEVGAVLAALDQKEGDRSRILHPLQYN